MPLTDLAFKTTFTPYRKLILLGEMIDDALIKSISPLNAELDYPDLTTFNIGNVSITLFDPKGNFNPNNPDNFWTQHWHRADLPQHYDQVGYKGSVEIHIGYNRDGTIESEKIFDGEVSNIRVNLQPPEIVIEAVDSSQVLRPAKVYGFGIERKVLLPEDADSGYSGRYPFPAYSIPSERSVSAETDISHHEMTDVGTIGTEGTSSPLNYQIANNAIETEGGPLWDPNKPIATFKDVYRYKRIETLLKNILDHYDVRNYDIDILEQQTQIPHFASNGRPGWELENLSTGLARRWNWDGYIKDVIYDSTNKRYYMLYGQQANYLPDWLISYDVETDSWERVATTNITISGLTYEYEMWQLASDDFENFYILATVHLRTGRDDLLVRGTYDTLESGTTSEIRILKYVKSTNTWSIIDDRSGNRPQIGFLYSAFPLPNLVGAAGRPMLPDSRTGFVIKEIDGNKELVYRGASGIQTYRLSDGTKSTLKAIGAESTPSVAADSLRSMDFWIGGTAETTFFAWIEQDNDGNSVLHVEDGNEVEIVNASYDNDDNPFFRAGGYSEIVTISDMIHHFGELYAVLQIRDGGQTREESEGSLININVASGNVSRVKHYDQFVRAARSPVIHKGEVYYFEGSHYQYQAHAEEIIRGPNRITPGGVEIPHSGSIVQIVESEPYPDETGHLIRMDGDEYIDFGLCWRSAFQNPLQDGEDLGFGRHGGTASPMISDGEAIHLWAGYGDLTKLNDPPVNDIDNWQWLQYGKNLPQRIPIFHTNGKKAWELMNELARLTNATLSYRQGRFSFLPRATRQATLFSDVSVTDISLILNDGDDSRFESTGTVLVNDELISYQFQGSNELSDLKRGVEGSQPTTHNRGDTVLFVHALVFNHPDKRNLGSLKFKPDFLGIYNQLTAILTPIEGEKAEVSVESADSIAANGEKPRDFNFDMLSWHERTWAEGLLNAYLTEMQQAQFEVNLELPWSPHLKLGQTLVVDQQVVAHLRWTPVRILRISHDFDGRTTQVTGRTFGLRRISQTTLAFDGNIRHHTFIVNQEITSFILPEAAGGLGTLAYSLSQLPPGMSFDVNTRAVAGTPTEIGSTIMTYTVQDMSTVPQTATLRFRLTVVAPLALDSNLFPDLVFQEGCYVDYQLPAASGGVPRVSYELGGLPSPLTFNPNTRRIQGIMPVGQWCLEYTAKDSAETANTVAESFDIVGDSTPQWKSLIVQGTGYGLLDGASNQVRLFDASGNRIGANGTFNIHIGSGAWTGAAIANDRRVYVETYRAAFYTLADNVEQTTEQISQADAVWVDVALIDDDKWGFLDKMAGAVRMYSLARTRLAAQDIEFGFCANWRSIAYFEDSNQNGKLAVLIEDLPTVLVWDITDAEFKEDEAIEIIAGSTGWQSVRLMDGNKLAVIRENATRIVVVDIATKSRSVSDDVVLR